MHVKLQRGFTSCGSTGPQEIVDRSLQILQRTVRQCMGYPMHVLNSMSLSLHCLSMTA